MLVYVVICLFFFCRWGLELLVVFNGWVDKIMNIGIKGMFNLIVRGYL